MIQISQREKKIDQRQIEINLWSVYFVCLATSLACSIADTISERLLLTCTKTQAGGLQTGSSSAKPLKAKGEKRAAESERSEIVFPSNIVRILEPVVNVKVYEKRATAGKNAVKTTKLSNDELFDAVGLVAERLSTSTEDHRVSSNVTYNDNIELLLLVLVL